MFKFESITKNNWVEWHASGISATDISRLMVGGTSGWNAIIMEKLYPTTCKNEVIEQVKAVESKIIACIQDDDFAIDANVSCTHENESWIAQLSGYNQMYDYPLEIKIAASENSKYLNKEVDIEVLYELNWQMLVTNTKKSRLIVVYNENICLDLMIEASQEIQYELVEVANRFWSLFKIKKIELQTGKVEGENDIDILLRLIHQNDQKLKALTLEKEKLRDQLFSKLSKAGLSNKKYVSLVATVSYKSKSETRTNELSEAAIIALGDDFSDTYESLKAQCTIVDNNKLQNLLLEHSCYQAKYNELEPKFTSIKVTPTINFISNKRN